MFIYIWMTMAWQNRTFGKSWRRKTWCGTVNHIRQELEEIEESDGKDPMEWIDVIILTIGGLRKTGVSPLKVVYLLWKKLFINVKRKWNAPDKDGIRNHVK